MSLCLKMDGLPPSFKEVILAPVVTPVAPAVTDITMSHGRGTRRRCFLEDKGGVIGSDKERITNRLVLFKKRPQLCHLTTSPIAVRGHMSRGANEQVSISSN